MSCLNLLFFGQPTVTSILVYPLSWLMGESLRIMSCLILLYPDATTVMVNGRITEHHVLYLGVSLSWLIGESMSIMACILVYHCDD